MRSTTLFLAFLAAVLVAPAGSANIGALAEGDTTDCQGLTLLYWEWREPTHVRDLYDLVEEEPTPGLVFLWAEYECTVTGFSVPAGPDCAPQFAPCALLPEISFRVDESSGAQAVPDAGGGFGFCTSGHLARGLIRHNTGGHFGRDLEGDTCSSHNICHQHKTVVAPCALGRRIYIESQNWLSWSDFEAPDLGDARPGDHFELPFAAHLGARQTIRTLDVCQEGAPMLRDVVPEADPCGL